MKTTYQTAIEKVSEGARFSVDFKKRTLRINRRKQDLDADSADIPVYDNLDDWLDEVENRYDNYKYSRPTKSSMEKHHRSYFKALTVDELLEECGHSALDNPQERDVAQAELELFILFSLLNGSFNPDELFAKDWFYQGADKSFVMCKNWF